jgi:CBS domain-containing protein
MPPPKSPARELPELLRRHRVFGRLDQATREDLASRFTREIFAPGETVGSGASLGERLGWVLHGRVALARGGEDGHVAVLESMELFGAGAVPHDGTSGWLAVADSPCEIAFLPSDDVARLCAEHPAMSVFLAPPASPVARRVRGADPHLSLMTTPLRSLLRRPPITLPPNATILETAQTMRDRGVSSMMLLEQDHLFGLVTDRDLRNRALAAGIDLNGPVFEIATVAPLTIDISQPAFEALLLMARQNVHHVPVLDGQRVAGMITATDLTEQQSTSAVYLASEIYKQSSVDDLAAAASRVKQLQHNLAVAGASAYGTGHIVTAITDAVTTRLLQLGEAKLGPPPVDYAWVAAGSQGRSEQTAKSDQDNCMILDDRYDEARHRAYFKALAVFVNDGMNASGYAYCPGEMMARTDEWRQPRRRWADYFRRWTETPEPKALMLTCVFFDMRMIYGRAALLDELRRDVLRRTRDNRIFLAYMVGNALTHRPPLTLFGGISTVSVGDVRDAVDLKHSGIVPIVDLARIYALAGGHSEVNTYDRLAVAAQGLEITEQSAHDLRDALEFMAGIRIRHQANQLAQGKSADNFLSLGELSNFERGQLKDAFGVVETLQSVLAQRYRQA